MGKKFLIGIDEAGRGPLAGPLSLAAILIENKKNLEEFSDIKDSKKLTHKAREEWFNRMRHAEKNRLLFSVHLFVTHEAIDRRGIVYESRKAIARMLKILKASQSETHILLDAGLSAPPSWSQESIIRGDEQFPIIAMASIIAKVKRDHFMVHAAKKYPYYGFAKHKGYGTDFHYDALKKYGPSPIHRLTFL